MNLTDSTVNPKTQHPWNAALFCYVLLIVYVSLFPFSGWRIPDGGIGTVVVWPRYYDAFDIILNIVAYMPLGIFIAAAKDRALFGVAALRHTLMPGFTLSLTLEFLQYFLPERFASSLDVLTNTTGALVGSLLAASPWGQYLLQWFARWRTAWFRADRAVDFGLILLAAWLVAQLNPGIPFFEAGSIADPLAVSWRIESYDPLRLILQSISIALNVCGFALFVSVLLHPAQRAWHIALFLMMVGLFLKFATAIVMLRTPLRDTLINPSLPIGLVTGALVSAYWMRLTQRKRLFFATLFVFAGGLMSKLTSLYSTFDETLRLFDWPYGHLGNFVSVTHYVNEVWPLLTLVFLAYCYIKQRL